MAEGDPMLGKPDSWRGHIISLSAEEDPVPTLYHTDTSYFSQIVRLVLEEEGVEYKSRHLDIHGSMDHLSPWFLRISPSGVVPTLVHKGKPVVESKDIALFVVENISSASHLLPSDEAERKSVLDLVDLHYKMPIEKLTMGTLLSSNTIMSFMLPRKNKSAIAMLENMKKDHPDLEALIHKKIEQKRSFANSVEDPLKVKESALEVVEEGLKLLEKKLEETGSEFMCGSRYSLADALFTCLLARLSMINLIEEQLRENPCLSQWWKKIQARESFANAGIVSTGVSAGLIIKKYCNIL